MIEVKCTKCHEWKPQECYSRDATLPSGYRSECKPCRAEYKRRRKAASAPRAVRRTTEAHRADMARELAVEAGQWARNVVDNNRPLRATIGGGYV